MSVQFEWQAGSDDGQWETIARAGEDRRRQWLRRMPWWGWSLLVLVLAGAGILGYVILQRRYEELQRQIEFQIQSVIDLEARAFASGDAELFLDQQDRELSDWYAQQARRIRENCRSPNDARWTVRDYCAPVQPAKIDADGDVGVDLRGDVAWVEVIEEQGRMEHPASDVQSVRKIRFYRQTELGWKHTAPRAEFWKTAIRVQYGNLFVEYHQRDMPDVVFLEELIASTVANVCATTLCPSTNTLIVDFTIEEPVYRFPYLEADAEHDGQDRLVLSSPWLSGIPVPGPDASSGRASGQGTWDEDYIERLTQAVAYATVTRAMRSTTKRDLNPLREAVADEYAAWFARGRSRYQAPQAGARETAELPLLGPIIEREGERVVPALLRSAKESRTSDQFLKRWLFLSLDRRETDPYEVRAYFEALLNLEREALLAGRKKTFLMFQDTTWWAIQERYYDRAQRDRSSLPREPVRVRTTQVLGDHARVTLEEPLPSLQGQPPQSSNNVVYYRLEDGDWRHANVLDAFFWTLIPTPTPRATPGSPTSTPTPTPRPLALPGS